MTAGASVTPHSDHPLRHYDRTCPACNALPPLKNELLVCPECGSDEVAVTAEQMFMVNSGEHYCHSVKTQDSDAQATCLRCRWHGERSQLKETP